MLSALGLHIRVEWPLRVLDPYAASLVSYSLGGLGRKQLKHAPRHSSLLCSFNFLLDPRMQPFHSFCELGTLTQVFRIKVHNVHGNFHTDGDKGRVRNVVQHPKHDWL